MKMSKVLLILGLILACGVAGYFGSGLATSEILHHYVIMNSGSSDRRLTFVAILSTLFAVFFVYSGFKIDTVVEKVEEAQRRILKLEGEVKDDVEFSNQLRYAMSFLTTKQYGKAIDALIVLRSESFVLKNDDRLLTCHFLLASSYYEQGCKDDDIESIAKATQFINLAIEDVNHPFRQEIIQKFEDMQELEDKA